MYKIIIVYRIINNIHTVFWLLFILLFQVLVLYFLVQRGMFADGALYTAMAENLAEGVGTFWCPKPYELISGCFYAHTPLTFGLQSIFFQVFGEHYLVERSYILVMAILTLTLVAKLWKEVVPLTYRAYNWVLLILLMTMPIFFWTFRHNMIENTLLPFVLASVWLLWKGYKRQKKIKRWFYYSLGVIGILGGFWTKEFVSLFPLATLFCIWLAFRSRSGWKMLKESLWLVVGLSGLTALVLWGIPGGYENLMGNFNNKALIFSNDYSRKVNFRGFIIWAGVMEILPALVLGGIVIGVSWIRQHRKVVMAHQKSVSLAFLLIGLAGSLPLMISPLQSRRYLLGALPFFALAIANLIVPFLHPMIEQGKWRVAVIKKINIGLIIACIAGGGIVLSKVGDFSRNKKLLQDVDLIGHHLQSPVMIGSSYHLGNNYALKSYLARYHDITVSNDGEHLPYFLSRSNSSFDPPKEYRRCEWDSLQILNIYYRSDSLQQRKQ